MSTLNIETLRGEASLKIDAGLEASKVISVATALGAKIPAPEGTYLYIALQYGDDHSYILGAYQHEEDAQKAIITRIIEFWKNTKFYPWDSNGNPVDFVKARTHLAAGVLSKRLDNDNYDVEFERTYLKTHSFEDIIAFAKKSWDSIYDIANISVSMPIRNVQTARINSIEIL